MSAKSKKKDLKTRTSEIHAQVAQKAKVQDSVLQALQKTNEIIEKVESVDQAKQTLDVEKARLKDVINEKARLQETVGTLIAGYDALTNALGGQIDSMKDMTTWESLVGFFSPRTAKQMREARVQQADIEEQLQDLMSQTQSINKLLSAHLEVLNTEYNSVKTMLDHQLDQQKAQTEVFEAADRRLEQLNTEIGETRDRMAELTGTERVKADEQLQALLNEANEQTEVRNTALSNAQTHELFGENHKIALDSLLRQKASQRVLIDKLRISTENRIIQYSATLESLRTAAQQESAHVINEVGTRIDQETARTMAAIGSAADRQIVEMLEKHAVEIGKRRATQADVARADAEFARRFADAARQFLEDSYEEGK